MSLQTVYDTLRQRACPEVGVRNARPKLKCGDKQPIGMYLIPT
jgi:hypothetical protein